MEITVSQIINFITILAGFLSSLGVVFAIMNKIISKRINTEVTEIVKPISQSLDEIKLQNHELKQQGTETREEIILIMKLNQTMINELKTLGHINGETSQALQDLNNYLINK